MILVTLGTHGQPMHRLVPALEQLARKDAQRGPFHAQVGSTPAPAGWFATPLIGPAELSALMGSCDILITHGGPATIAEARAVGRIPIVIPRQRRFGEHVDDHQLDYARRLAAVGEVILVEDAARLVRTVEEYPKLIVGMPAARPHDPASAIAAMARIADRLLAHTGDGQSPAG